LVALTAGEKVEYWADMSGEYWVDRKAYMLDMMKVGRWAERLVGCLAVWKADN
jgi:hypothetical protein